MNQPLTICPKLPASGPGADSLLDTAIEQSEALARFIDGAQSNQANQSSILIIINDSHRSTLTQPTLQALSRYCVRHRLDIKCNVLVACGTHTIDLSEQRDFERCMFEGVDLPIESITWHDCDAAAGLTQIGDYRFHQLLLDHTFLLPIGSVEPHYFAGFTGAHKTVTVGCLARQDIEKNHEYALSEGSDVLQLAGNPVYDGIVDMLAALTDRGKQICCVNQVVCGRELCCVEVGDPLLTLDLLTSEAKRAFVHDIDRGVDWMELHVPLPLGRSLYQADKALKNNHLAVRNGGGIVLIAPCPDGVGDAAFLDVLRRSKNYREATSLVAANGYRLGDHKAVKLRYLTDAACRDVRVAVVAPGLDDDDARTASLRSFDDVQQARHWLAETMTGSNDRGLIIHDAGFVVARPTRS